MSEISVKVPRRGQTNVNLDGKLFLTIKSTGRPVRIQRRRTKGWRMPAGAIYVGLPSRWGNSFRPPRVRGPLDAMLAELSVGVFRDELRNWNHDTRVRWLEPLRGHDLVCWCPLDQPCHADVLLELANA